MLRKIIEPRDWKLRDEVLTSMATVTKDRAQGSPAGPSSLKIPETNLSDSKIRDILITARIRMVLKLPFFGTVASRMNFIDATKWCPTLATDGRNFYYNKNFVAALSFQEVIFGVAHEVMHCVYDHLDRAWIGPKRNMALCNIAQDYVINLQLTDHGVGKKINLVQICHDQRFRGMMWKEVYDQLRQECQDQGVDPENLPQKTLDYHISDDEQKRQPGDDSPGTGNNDGSEGPVRYDQDELEKIDQETADGVIQAYKAAGAGNAPGGVKRIMDKLLNPKLDWRELLAMQIQSVIRSDYTWMNPSRKGMAADMYLPGMDREQTIDISIAIDTSGSISDTMMRDFLTEVAGIMAQYNDFTIKLWCFDTSVHNCVTITADTLNEFENYEMAGFGGTMFECNWEFMKENGIEPKKFVMFTDGYPFGSWGDEFYCDTLFIVHGGRGGDVPQSPFGLTVPYETEE